jgi:hypothetical protein
MTLSAHLVSTHEITAQSPANAGLSFQEKPSNVTFTIDDHKTSAAGCARHLGCGGKKTKFSF